jgi:uncharacterized protein YegP (UPF0339 family)
MTARFEVVRTDAAQPWHARFRAANRRIVWTTEQYTQRIAAIHAIGRLARTFSPTGQVWVVTKGKPIFVEIGTGDGHLRIELDIIDERTGP